MRKIFHPGFPKIYGAIAILFFYFSAQAQTITGVPVRDALKLKSYLDNLQTSTEQVDSQSNDSVEKAKAVNINADAILSMLNYYAINSINNLNDLKTSDINFFINTYVRNILKQQAGTLTGLTDAEATNMDIAEIGNAQSGILNATTTLDALGTFIAERFKEELTIEYLERFRETVSEIPEFKSFFPSTLQVISKNDPFLYNSFLTSMQSSVKDDLNKIPEHLITYATENFDRLPESIKNDQTKYMVTFIQMCHSIFSGNTANGAMNEMSNIPLFKSTPATDPMHNYLMLASLVSSTLTDQDGTWIKDPEILKVFADPEIFQLFIGLAMMKEEKNNYATGRLNLFESIQFNGKTLSAILESETDNLKPLAIYWETASSAFVDMKEKFMKIKDELGAGSNEDDVVSLLSGLTFLINKMPSLIPSEQINAKYFHAQFNMDEFKSISNKVNELNAIYLHVSKKEYSLALNKLMLMLDDGTTKNDFIHCISKYGLFLTTLAEADNKDEMYEAIKTAALPVGSFRIKRMSKSNIALNAFAGGFYGWDLQTDTSKTMYYGFTAPVGLTFSSSFGARAEGSIPNQAKTYFSSNSISLFISIIDIGAITAFRVTNDSTETLPSITWNNFIAPGAYLVWGIRKSPLSISAGAQYGPQIKKLNDLNTDAFAKWNFRLSCTVDIPLLNLNTKPYDNKPKEKKKNK